MIDPLARLLDWLLQELAPSLPEILAIALHCSFAHPTQTASAIMAPGVAWAAWRLNQLARTQVDARQSATSPDRLTPIVLAHWTALCAVAVVLTLGTAAAGPVALAPLLVLLGHRHATQHRTDSPARQVSAVAVDAMTPAYVRWARALWRCGRRAADLLR